MKLKLKHAILIRDAEIKYKDKTFDLFDFNDQVYKQIHRDMLLSLRILHTLHESKQTFQIFIKRYQDKSAQQIAQEVMAAWLSFFQVPLLMRQRMILMTMQIQAIKAQKLKNKLVGKTLILQFLFQVTMLGKFITMVRRYMFLRKSK